MSKPVIDFVAIRSIADQIAPAESDLHGAIASNAELMASVIRAEGPMNISPIVTHGVVTTLASANTDLIAGMGKTLAVHAQLAELRDRIGLRTVDFGGGKWKGDDILSPESGAADSAVSPIRLAATA